MHPSPLPADHPQRRELAAEVHSRPPTPADAPAVVTCVALTDAAPAVVQAALREWAAEQAGSAPPSTDAPHLVLELPSLRLKWERHGEFVSLTFVRALPGMDLGTAAATDRFPTALSVVPAASLAALTGRVVAAADILVLPGGPGAPAVERLQPWFTTDALAGSQVLDGKAWLFTDFVLTEDGRTRWLVLDAGMSRPQSARLVQRLIEIEIYRMMALLAFPLARAALPALNRSEQELERITSATAALHAETATPLVQDEERRLLDELSRVAAEVERSVAATAFRFSAAEAYWRIVRSRVAELREQRLGTLRTIGGFLSRRMTPAMDSCAAAARRHDEISARIERASSLLRTRVDIAREEQNQRLLAAMERRGKLQLRLQQTVEGLSVAAITYYMAGLVGYAVKPLTALWPSLKPEWIVAATIPAIAVGVWLSMRRIRRRLEGA